MKGPKNCGTSVQKHTVNMSKPCGTSMPTNRHISNEHLHTLRHKHTKTGQTPVTWGQSYQSKYNTSEHSQVLHFAMFFYQNRLKTHEYIHVCPRTTVHAYQKQTKQSATDIFIYKVLTWIVTCHRWAAGLPGDHGADSARVPFALHLFE